MSVPRRRLFIIGTVLLLVAAAVVTWFVVMREDDEAGRLAGAVALAPESSTRLGWTDWAGLREELDDSDLDAASSTREVDGFLTAGFDADLTSTSALVSSAPVLHAQFGFSPATIDWELFAQGEEGAIILMGLPDPSAAGDVEDALEEVGYQQPNEDDGVWIGGPDLLATIGNLSQELAFITVDRERGVIAASDESETLESWRDEERGDADDALAEVTDDVEGALAASIYDGDYACVALAMTEADDVDRTRAAELLDEAGEIHPMRAFAIAARPGGDVRVAMAFETEDQARTNADTRARLAAGPAPGQGGAFPDRFTLGDVTADGTVVRMELEPLPASYVMSDLANGPVLFATC
ncbi:hypothetical protein [Nocardioides stalactiti]|uniref:hypothetical protein n=1 Tax=Nocardioides stalactiti TaxID=2755356 RepID=UPI0016018BBC|nr:hypothetical protein [Nocardioides stalactiti]